MQLAICRLPKTRRLSARVRACMPEIYMDFDEGESK